MKNSVNLTEQLQQLLVSLRAHLIVLSVILFAGLCAYLLLLTATLLQAEPEAAAISEQANAVSSPKVSQEIVQTINSLEDRNVQIQTIFEEARDNPFTE